MALSLPTLLESLGTLEPRDLRQVALKTKALLALNGHSTAPNSEDRFSTENGDDYLMEGIYAALRREGLLSPGRRVPQRSIPPGYAQKSADVRVMLESRLDKLSRQDKVALGQLCGEALLKNMKRIGCPLTPSAALDRVHRIPLALDDAYPGYLKAGLLSSCWK